MDPTVKQTATGWQKCKHLHTCFSKWCFISWESHLGWSRGSAPVSWEVPVPPMVSPGCVCVCVCVCVCLHMLSLQSCPSLYDPTDCSPPGSSVHGILQARILESLVMPSSKWSSQTRNQTCVSQIFCVAAGFFTAELQGKPPWSPSHIHFPGKPKSHIAGVTLGNQPVFSSVCFPILCCC